MSIREDQRRFYADLWRRHGEDPRSLGHRDRATQYERFERLARCFESEEGPFSVHEIGCGLGDFGRFLQERCPAATYSGSDIHEDFVEVCRGRFPQGEFHVRDVTEALPAQRYDYVTQSGTFNGRLNAKPAEWQRFVFDMLEAMYRLSRKGLASNFLTTYHDPQYTDGDLHYQDPRLLTDFVVERLSRHFQIDAAGPLYEYTLVVLRPEFVARSYDAEAFRRYFRSLPDPGRSS